MLSSAMLNDKIKIIVPGSLNTDIIGLGVNRIAGPGELAYGNELRIGPGGKSRNIAQMIACFTGPGTVAMLGRSAKDPYGLWKLPVDALKDAGVVTEHIKYSGSGFPGIALIPVDKDGTNQIYVLPGVNRDFSIEDVESSGAVFCSAKKNNGAMALSLELPRETAEHAIKKANDNGLKVVLDPGGIEPGVDNGWISKQDLFAIKPNEHEAKILTGVTVSDLKSAESAAAKLLEGNIENVFITAGAAGAYFFSKGIAEHIRAPELDLGGARDETGCGDQATAVFTAYSLLGRSALEAARSAVTAGGMQFHRAGIAPVTREQLEAAESKR